MQALIQSLKKIHHDLGIARATAINSKSVIGFIAPITLIMVLLEKLIEAIPVRGERATYTDEQFARTSVRLDQKFTIPEYWAIEQERDALKSTLGKVADLLEVDETPANLLFKLETMKEAMSRETKELAFGGSFTATPVEKAAPDDPLLALDETENKVGWHRAMPKALQEAIIKEYESGNHQTLLSIAKKFHKYQVGVWRIRNLLTSRGIYEARRVDRIGPEKQNAAVILATCGWKQLKISRALSVSQPTVSQYLKKHKAGVLVDVDNDDDMIESHGDDERTTNTSVPEMREESN